MSVSCVAVLQESPARRLEARRLPVFHVVLTCDEDELKRRIEGDEVEAQARDWRIDHIAKFQEARVWMARSADLVIDTTSTAPSAVARQIVAAAKVTHGRTR